MSKLRLVLATRRYWPLVGGAGTVLSRLASELRRAGDRPAIVTACWDRHWPRQIEHHGTPLTRLSPPPTHAWNACGFALALARHLRQHRGDYDLLHLSSLRHEAFTAIGAARAAGVAIVLATRTTGADSDLAWQQTTRLGRIVRRRCRTADAFVAPSRAVEEAWLAWGCPPDRVHVIPDGVPLPPPRCPSRRLAARKTLGEIHPDLLVDAQSPLAVYVGRLQEERGLPDLLQAWSELTPSHPAARLWLVGDGPHRAALAEAVADRGLASSVRLPGAFDTIEEILDAADVLVRPGPYADLPQSLLEAMAAGLPVVATDSAAHRALIEHDAHGLLVPAHDPKHLAAALRRVLREPDHAQRLGRAARRRIELEFSLEQTVRQYRQLFHRMTAERKG